MEFVLYSYPPCTHVTLVSFCFVALLNVAFNCSSLIYFANSLDKVVYEPFDIISDGLQHVLLKENYEFISRCPKYEHNKKNKRNIFTQKQLSMQRRDPITYKRGALINVKQILKHSH